MSRSVNGENVYRLTLPVSVVWRECFTEKYNSPLRFDTSVTIYGSQSRLLVKDLLGCCLGKVFSLKICVGFALSDYKCALCFD